MNKNYSHFKQFHQINSAKQSQVGRLTLATCHCRFSHSDQSTFWTLHTVTKLWIYKSLSALWQWQRVFWATLNEKVNRVLRAICLSSVHEAKTKTRFNQNEWNVKHHRIFTQSLLYYMGFQEVRLTKQWKRSTKLNILLTSKCVLTPSIPSKR